MHASGALPSFFAAAALAALFAPDASASLVADGGEETILGNEAVHKFVENGTFTLYADSTVRLLVVGGGGGGGGDCSGAGGGGGVIEADGVPLAAGRYSVVVGGGGLFGSSSGNTGENGGDSVVTLVASDGTGTELYRAYGGGGGGCWNKGDGNDGGSGGGATHGATPGKGVPGQGFDAVRDTGPGAGGGAGGSPLAANVGNGNGGLHQADGGPGRTNDITGTLQVYGPGGGAGGYNGYGGLGGDREPDGDGLIWGCGWNHSSCMTDEAMAAAGYMQAGRPGHGGGGGGGSNSHYSGGSGGSGVVVFRLANAFDSPAPTLAVPSVSPSWFSISFPALVSYAGIAASADEVALSLQFSSDAADFGEDGSFAGTETMLDARFFGSGEFSVPDLRPGRDYYLRLVARNDAGGETFSDVIAARTLAQDEPRWIAPGGRPVEDGLLAYRYDKTNYNYEDFDESAEGLVVLPGTATAGISSSSNGQGLYGMVYVAPDGSERYFPKGVSDGYLGYMWMEAGRRYNFFSCFFDNLRMKIGDDFTFNQPTYNSPHVFSYEPEDDGWRRIQIWFGGSQGGAGNKGGWTYSFGWNVDGATSVSGTPGTADWHMLDLDSGARLKTGLPGREVAVAVAGYAQDGGGDLVFAVSAGAGAPGTLFAAWGGAYPGAPEDVGAWENSATVGDVSGDAQTAGFAIPGSAKYVRFALVQDDGTVCWSPTSQIDLSAVSLVDLGVESDGDRAEFSVRVSSVGTGDFSLALEIADNAAMEGARSIPVEAGAPGDYAVPADVAAGATSWYRFVGTTSDGGRDETAVTSFTTLGATTGIPANPAVTVDNHTVTVSFPDLAFGAGKQSWTVLAGPDAESMAERESWSLSPVLGGGYVMSIPFPEWTRTWNVKIVSRNVSPGGLEWTVETSRFSVTTKDSVSYTWKAAVAEGSWTDPGNWTFSSSDRLCNGYPSNGNCAVYFPKNAEASISIPEGAFPLSKLYMDAEGSRIVLSGAGRGATVLSGDAYGGTMKGESFEMSALEFVESDRFDGGIGSNANSRDSAYRLSGGGLVTMRSGEQRIRGTNSAIRVEGGSEMRLQSAIVYLDGCGETVLLDDSSLSCACVHVEREVSLGPQTVRFRGPGAKLAVRDGIFSDFTSNAMKNDVALLFEVPSGGYADGPALFSSATGTNNGTAALPLGSKRNAASTGRFVVAADASAMRNGPGAKCFLVGWKAGIDENAVRLAPGEGCELRFTWGWDAASDLPAGLGAPENEGDLPTGIFCIAPSRAGTLVFVR